MIENSFQNVPSPFPLMSLTPKMFALLRDIKGITGAPDGLIVSTALAASASAVQGGYNVRRSANLISPCSLYVITIAESGERKTTVDSLLFRPFVDFEKRIAAELHSEADHAQKAPKSGGVRLLYSDTTPMAFLRGLHRNSPAAVLCEDEAGRIFTSKMVDDLGLLNKLWQGQSIAVDRASSRDSFRLDEPRACISWMIQPQIFQRYMARHAETARGIGFLARCLVAYPMSTQGYRLTYENDPQPRPGIDVWSQRVIELLSQQHEKHSCDNEGVSRDWHELTFDFAAQQQFQQIYSQIECAIRPGGALSEARDFASKVAENIARIAGVLHVIEGYEGLQISANTLQSATTVGIWFAEEFVRLFAEETPDQVMQKLANKLEQWLMDYFQRTGQFMIPKNLVLQLGPNSLRKAATLEIALNCLVMRQRIYLIPSWGPHGGHKKAHMTICLCNTNQLPSQRRWSDPGI